MKNIIRLSSLLFLFCFTAFAQVEDQNPNFQDSMDYYLKAQDSLSQTLGTTVQQTYKAYDWYEAREERRAQRREYRHKERMNRNYYSVYYNYPSYRWIPRYRYRTGDYWFSF